MRLPPPTGLPRVPAGAERWRAVPVPSNRGGGRQGLAAAAPSVLLPRRGGRGRLVGGRGGGPGRRGSDGVTGVGERSGRADAVVPGGRRPRILPAGTAAGRRGIPR